MIKLSAITGQIESETIEAKRSEGGLPESIWETYSAFANTGGGVILLGVEENFDKTLSVSGVDNAETLIAEFRRCVQDTAAVSADILSPCDVFVQRENSRDIVVIHVPEAPALEKPVYVGGSLFSGAYKRVGESDVHLNKWEVYEILRRKWVKKTN